MLAEATAHILCRLLRGDLDPERVRGIYHATNGGATSWFDFARTILALSGRHCRLLPIPTREYPAPSMGSSHDHYILSTTIFVSYCEWIHFLWYPIKCMHIIASHYPLCR